MTFKGGTQPVLSFKSKKGFTLIEILVVLFIMVFIFTLASRRLFSSQRKINTTFNELVRLNRRLYTSSRVHRNVYRLSFKLNETEPDEFWVEKQEMDKEIGKKFILDENFFEEPQRINPLLNISSVESMKWGEAKTSGMVYIYYYPKGLSQELAIQFLRPDNQGRWTLYRDPIQREFQILEREKTIREIKESL